MTKPPYAGVSCRVFSPSLGVQQLRSQELRKTCGKWRGCVCVFTTLGVRPSPVLPSGAEERREGAGGSATSHLRPGEGAGRPRGGGGGATAALPTAQPRGGRGEPAPGLLLPRPGWERFIHVCKFAAVGGEGGAGGPGRWLLSLPSFPSLPFFPSFPPFPPSSLPPLPAERALRLPRSLRSMAGPAAVRRRGPGCGSLLLLLPALLESWAACQAPPVPAAEIPPDGTELGVERRFVPESCPRAVRPGDFVRYHYIGAFPDGTRFDSRCDTSPVRGLVGHCEGQRRGARGAVRLEGLFFLWMCRDCGAGRRFRSGALLFPAVPRGRF